MILIRFQRVRSLLAALTMIVLTSAEVRSRAASSAMLQDFEKAFPAPTVWVVDIPNDNASVQLSTNEPHEGKQCLKLHYHFLATGKFQYLGIPNKVGVQSPVHKL